MSAVFQLLLVAAFAIAAFAGDDPDSVCVDTFYVNDQPKYLVACDHVWVKWHEDVPHDSVIAVEEELKLDTLSAPFLTWVLYTIADDLKPEDAVAALRVSEWIYAAHPDQFAEACLEYAPSDPLWPQQRPYLGVDPENSEPPSGNLGSTVDKAWAFTRGHEDVNINLIDTGEPDRDEVFCEWGPIHPDFFLSHTIRRCTRFYLTQNSDYWFDSRGHATIMAGILGAFPENEGIVGLNHGSPILISKITNTDLPNFMLLSDFVSAVSTTLGGTDNMIFVFPYAVFDESDPFESCEDFELLCEDLLVVEDGICFAHVDGNQLFVFPVGNVSGSQTNMAVPAVYSSCSSIPDVFPNGWPNVITARSYQGHILDFEGTPSGPNISVAAPGGYHRCPGEAFDNEDILSTTLWHELSDCMSSRLITAGCQTYDWDWFAGSSAACANAAGLISLVWSTMPDATAAFIKEVVQSTCTNPTQGNNGYHGWTDDWGWGAINTLEAIASTPSATDLTLISDLVIDNRVNFWHGDPFELRRSVVVPSGKILEIRNEVASLTFHVADGVEIIVQSGGQLIITQTTVPESPLAMKFGPGARIIVEDGGRISAAGTAGQRILFTAESGDPADAWSGIYLQSTGNVFDYCDFENASVAIRAYSGGGATLDHCTFDNCGIGIASINHANVTATNCTVTDSRVYGMYAQLGTITAIQGSVSTSARAGVWVLGTGVADLYAVDVSDNGSFVDWNQGGLRNSFGTLKLKCVKSYDNNGPGVTCLGGFTLMAPLEQYGRNTITNNLAPNEQARTQIYFNNAQFDLCNGRNKVCAADGLQISDTAPLEHDVRNNYWCGEHNYPAEYVSSVEDDETTDNRCGLTSFNWCAETGPAQWFYDGWIMENDLQFASAILNYQYVIEYFPDSDEAKLCPDRILFCESMLTKDWDTWRVYFREIADTTQNDALKFEVLASAAWCQVEKGELDSAYQEFDELMNQSSSEYEYQKAALAALMAELAEAGWDTIGIERHRGQRAGRGVDSQVQTADPLLDLVDRMEAVLSGRPRLRPNVHIPVHYALHQNYPNPFNAVTEIRFDLPENARVELSIFNTIGQKIATLINDARPAGTHRVKWDASSVASGVYLYQLKAGNFTQTKKMILLK